MPEFLCPQAILFDHDGVLVASEALHNEAWGVLLHELGMEYSPDEIQRLVGRTAPQILRSELNRQRSGWRAEDYDLDALALRKNDHYLDLLTTRLRPYPGVREGLEWLRDNGIRAAVVSNAKRRELTSALEGLGLAPFFSAILSRDDLRAPKPDPDAYLTGALHAETDPARCLVVEDSPPGLQSALLGGVPAAAVMTNFPREALQQPVPGRPDLRPVWIGSSMVDFFAWLRNLPQAGQ
jgi:HAD superfamily hydrolase (TIGR01509 family)